MATQLNTNNSPLTCEGHIISEPVFGVPGAPALVMGDDGKWRQDVVSVWFFGDRRIVDRALWDHVYEILGRKDS